MVTTWVINPTVPGSNGMILHSHTSFSLSRCFSLFQSQGMWEGRSLKLKYAIVQRIQHNFFSVATLMKHHIEQRNNLSYNG